MGQDLKGADRVVVIQNWENQPEPAAYCHSDQLGTFVGTFHWIKNKPILEIHAVSSTSTMEAVKAARSRAKSRETRSQ